MIQLQHVTKHFGDLKAIDHLDLMIHDNDFYGVIGMSGAGKSTLIRLINGLIQPDEGNIIIDNQVVNQIDAKELRTLRQNIGMIFQHFNLLTQQTVLDNVALPLKLKGIGKSERIQKAQELLSLVGLSDKAKAYPNQLSGGQKQRVAIARALINDNKILLCDEATSALDPISTQGVLALLKDLQKKLGLTIIMITHEMKVIEQVCNKVAILDHGKLIEEGKVSEIFKNPKHSVTKQLLFKEESIDINENSSIIRLIFDGSNAYQPIVSQMVLSTKQPINILSADTREIEGKQFGQMIIQVPKLTQSLLDFLDQCPIAYQIERQETK